MAAGASGTFALNGTKGMMLKVAWSESYDPATGKSAVSIDNIYLKSEWYYATYYLEGSVKVADAEAVAFSPGSGNHYIAARPDGEYYAVSAASNPAPWKVSGIVHEADGSKSVTISVNLAGYTTSGDDGHGWKVSGSKTIALTVIPKATSMDYLSCSTEYFTGKLTFKYTPQNYECYNRCNITLHKGSSFLDVKSMLLGKKTASQQTVSVSLTEEELATVYNLLPSGTSGALRFTLRTYSDPEYKNQIEGSGGYKEITLNIPEDAKTKPSVSMSLVPVGSLPSAFAGLFIQGKTKVKAILSAEGKYGASIKSYSMKVGSDTYGSEDNYTSDYLAQNGMYKVYGSAVDARGFSGSTSADISVIPYSSPRILPASGEADVVAARCDADGNLSDSGTYLKIKAKRSYSKVVSGNVQKNFCQIRYRHKLASASSWSSWVTVLDAEAAEDEIVTGALLGGVLSVQSTYLVQVQAIDDIGGHTETTFSIPTEIVHSHKTKNGLGLGKYCEGENLLDVGWDAHFRGEVRVGENGMTLKDYILSVISEGG